MKAKSISALVYVLLSACSPSSEISEKSDQSNHKQASKSPLLETQLEALQQSKKLEKRLQEQADERRKQMEERGI